MPALFDASFTQIVIDNKIHYTHDISGVATENMRPVKGKYIGFFYTIVAYGGFYIQQQLPRFKLLGNVGPSPNTFLVKKYDVTNALQILFSTRFINEKLGGFDIVINRFKNNSITLTGKDFISNISASQIISLGLFTNLYRNFIHYVNNYFSYGSDFLSLFSSNDELMYKDANFDANAFIELINNTALSDDTGMFSSQISGTITINYLNELLIYLNKDNVLGNRPLNRVEDGFVEGDLILIPDGISITLSLNVDFNNTLPRSDIYNIKRSFKDSCNDCCKDNDDDKPKNKNLPLQSLSNVQRTFTAPLMLKLQNL